MEAPQPAAAAPPAPQASAPRPADLTKHTPSSEKMESPVATTSPVPAAPLECAPVVPVVPEVAKSNFAVDARVEEDAAASRGVGAAVAAPEVVGVGVVRAGSNFESGGGGDVSSPAAQEKQTSPAKGAFGSPGRHRVPAMKSELDREGEC